MEIHILLFSDLAIIALLESEESYNRENWKILLNLENGNNRIIGKIEKCY